MEAGDGGALLDGAFWHHERNSGAMNPLHPGRKGCSVHGMEHRTTDQFPERWGYLERQFCSLCRAQGRPGVRVISVNERVLLGDVKFRRVRRAAFRRHLKEVHGR